MEITGKMLEWRKVFLVQLLPGWNEGPKGHIFCNPFNRGPPDGTYKQLLRLMMLTIARSY